MYTISLNKLAFFAHHGLHGEEAITGSNFEVDVRIKFRSEQKITSLDQTINYVEVYEVIKLQMTTPVLLLETLAEKITDSIYDIDARISMINIRLTKLHPPIKNFIGSVAVTYTKRF